MMPAFGGSFLSVVFCDGLSCKITCHQDKPLSKPSCALMYAALDASSLSIRVFFVQIVFVVDGPHALMTMNTLLITSKICWMSRK